MKKYLKILLPLIYLFIIFFSVFKEINSLILYFKNNFGLIAIVITVIILLIIYFIVYKLFSLIIEGILNKKIWKVIIGFLILIIITIFFIFLKINMFPDNCGINGCRMEVPCIPGFEEC